MEPALEEEYRRLAGGQWEDKVFGLREQRWTKAGRCERWGGTGEGWKGGPGCTWKASNAVPRSRPAESTFA